MARDDHRATDRERCRGSAAGGFTLLEVLVALAIAVPALLLLYRQGALSLDATRSASRYTEAISRAQSRLDAMLDATLDARDREGDEGNGFHWHTSITPITSGPVRRDGGRPGSAGSATLYAVTVEISWPNPAGSERDPRRVRLVTRLAGPVTEATR